ncbi:DUF1573 domain-containing protein [Pontiellaceae bacterium B12219]|nr:DUF1573 domain-containing protein [Pontiellaceae bacterium B12219]
MKRLIGCLVYLLVLGSSAWADLRWAQERISQQVHPLQESVDLQFTYANEGDEPVEIVRIESSCGCMVPRSGKRTVMPGATGTVEVSFSLRGRTGTQKKYVQVYTADSTKRPYRLDVEVNIPESYVPSVKRVIWDRAAQYEPQTVILTNHYAEAIELVEAVPSLGTLQAELTAVQPGREYALKISPAPGMENFRGYIRLRPEPLDGETRPKEFKVYVFIR